MRLRRCLMVAAIASLISANAFAEGDDHQENKGPVVEQAKPEAPAAVEAGNEVCPVSGEMVGGMGPAIKVEHNGKIYNLCCAGCIAKFKADPDKYIKIVDEGMKRGDS